MLSWKENPAPTFQQDRLVGAGIAFHVCAIVLIAVLMIISVNRAAPSPFSLEFHSPTEEWLRKIVAVEDLGLKSISMVAAVLAAGIGGFTLGVIASFPFVGWFVRPILVHIVPDGLIYGNTYTSWQDIGRWQDDLKKTNNLDVL